MVAKSIAKMYTNIHKPTDYIACILLFALINCQLAGSLIQREVGVSIHAKMHLVHSLH